MTMQAQQASLPQGRFIRIRETEAEVNRYLTNQHLEAMVVREYQGTLKNTLKFYLRHGHEVPKSSEPSEKISP